MIDATEGIARYGSLVTKTTVPLFTQVCKDTGTPKSALLEVLLLGIPPQDIAAIIARGSEARARLTGTDGTDRKGLLATLKQLPSDRVAALHAALQAQGPADPPPTN